VTAEVIYAPDNWDKILMAEWRLGQLNNFPVLISTLAELSQRPAKLTPNQEADLPADMENLDRCSLERL